jgi:hypothetical protein
VATDDLYSPLGLSKKPARFPDVLAAAAGALGIGFGTFAIWVMVRSDPFGVERRGESGLSGGGDLDLLTGAATAVDDGDDLLAAAGNGPVLNVFHGLLPLLELRNFLGRTDGAGVFRRGRIGLRWAKLGRHARLRRAEIGLGHRHLLVGGIVEMTRDGPIPRVGANGMRAAMAYAQRSGAKPNAPQIAIVVTGIGTSNAAATEALNKLPAAVTLAFAPNGGDLERLAGKARSLGHELLLQVPMESGGHGAESRAAGAADLVTAGSEYGAPALADEPVPGLGRHRRPGRWPLHRLGSGVRADPARDHRSGAHSRG